MASMFVRHKVNDHNQWKRAYDDFASVRKQSGVTSASVYRDLDDPNTIIVTHQFPNMSAALDFANSDDLQSAMEQAGVNGRPEIWFGDDVEHTTY